MRYYNTTKEQGAKLQEYLSKAQTQDQKIADFFELNPGEIFTPWEVLSIVFVTATPITSVRRSINSLTRAGVLTKTPHMKEAGAHGRRSFCWSLNEKYYLSLTSMQTILEDPKTSAKVEPVLFDVDPLPPIPCRRCGKMLTVAYSINAGLGPVCLTKCEPI